MFDANLYAERILSEVTANLMKAAKFVPLCDEEEDANPEIYDILVNECATVLVSELLNFTITPVQYNMTRNALGDMLFKVCFSDDAN